MVPVRAGGLGCRGWGKFLKDVGSRKEYPINIRLFGLRMSSLLKVSSTQTPKHPNPTLAHAAYTYIYMNLYTYSVQGEYPINIRLFGLRMSSLLKVAPTLLFPSSLLLSSLELSDTQV